MCPTVFAAFVWVSAVFDTTDTMFTPVSSETDFSWAPCRFVPFGEIVRMSFPLRKVCPEIVTRVLFVQNNESGTQMILGRAFF